MIIIITKAWASTWYMCTVGPKEYCYSLRLQDNYRFGSTRPNMNYQLVTFCTWILFYANFGTKTGVRLPWRRKFDIATTESFNFERCKNYKFQLYISFSYLKSMKALKFPLLKLSSSSVLPFSPTHENTIK